MTPRAYKFTTNICFVVGMVDVLLFDRFNHFQWLLGGSAVVAGAIAISLYFYVRWQPPLEQNASEKANESVSVTPPLTARHEKESDKGVGEQEESSGSEQERELMIRTAALKELLSRVHCTARWVEGGYTQNPWVSHLYPYRTIPQYFSTYQEASPQSIVDTAVEIVERLAPHRNLEVRLSPDPGGIITIHVCGSDTVIEKVTVDEPAVQSIADQEQKEYIN